MIGCWPFRRRRKGRAGNNDLVQTPSSHPQPPRLVKIRREESPLLSACWNQDWNAVLQYLETPQIYHYSHNTGRTALHLATIPGARCPAHVLRAMVRANPHAVVTQDFHKYGGTPLHFCCGSHLRQDAELVRFMVETALDMYQTFGDCRIRLSFWSPLFQAARWAAPPASLQILVQASHQQPWIGPWTGAEAWTAQMQQHGLVRRQPFRDSPLQALWRRKAELFQNVHDLPLDAFRQLAMDYYVSEDPWQFWLNRFPKEFSSSEDSNNHHSDGGNQDNSNDCPALVQWGRILVLLRDQATHISDIVPTVASLHTTIPALVRLVTVLWPTQVLVPTAATSSAGAGRLPLHTAVTRYLAAAAEADIAFSEQSKADRRDAAQQVVEILALAQAQALVIADPVTGLPPAWHVASNASVDLIYSLLRPAPAQLVPKGGYSQEDPVTLSKSSSSSRQQQ